MSTTRIKRATAVSPFTRFLTFPSRGSSPSQPVGQQFLLAAALGLAAVACGGADDLTADAASEATETTAAPDEAATPDETASSEAAGPDADGVPTNDADSADNGVVEELFPDVIAVESAQETDGTWSFDVTLSSPYDSPERYADAWRVVGPDGAVYGERILTHDHASEQPFTRSQSDIEIPDDVVEVLVEGRDQLSGWGGATITHALTP